MDPLTVLILLFGGLVGGAGTTIAYFTNRDVIETQFFGKKIILLGASGSGKTTLYRALGMMPALGLYPEATTSPEPTNRVKLSYNIGQNNPTSKQVRFRSTYDVPGNETKHWQEKGGNAELIFYLINASKLFEEASKNLKPEEKELFNRIQKDLSEIEGWIKTPKQKLFIIGSHCDEIKSECNNKYGQYLDTFKKLLKPIDTNRDYSNLATDILVANLLDRSDVPKIMGGILNHLHKKVIFK